MTHDDLKQLGYRQQPDGSWSRAAAGVARLPDAKLKHHARPALEPTPPAQGRGKGRVTVCITRRSSRLLDADNFAGGTKPLGDQLRYAGLIADDDPATIEAVFRQEKCPKGQEMTIVEISSPSI